MGVYAHPEGAGLLAAKMASAPDGKIKRLAVDAGQFMIKRFGGLIVYIAEKAEGEMQRLFLAPVRTGYTQLQSGQAFGDPVRQGQGGKET